MKRLLFILLSIAIYSSLPANIANAVDCTAKCVGSTDPACYLDCTAGAGNNTTTTPPDCSATCNGSADPQCYLKCTAANPNFDPTNPAGVTTTAAPAPAPTTSSYASNPITLLNPLNTNDPRVLVGRLIQAIIGISGGIALVMFIYSGLLFLTAAGDTSQVSKAKNLMIQVVLGIIIIAAAFVVTNTLFNAVLTGNAVIGSGAPNKPL